MSILTKIFVVLSTIAAVVFVSLVVAYVNNVQVYKTQLDGVRQELATAQKRAALVESELQTRKQEDASRENQIQVATNALQNQLNEKLSEINALKANLVAKEDQLTRATNDLSAAVTAKEQSQNIIDKLNTELLQRRKEAIEAQRDLLAISDQLQEKTADLESLNETVRLLREQLVNMEQQLKAAQAQPTAIASTAAPTPQVTITDTPIQGIITEVQTVAEDTFVAINLGSNDEVAEGMNFIIHNNGDYVGSMLVIKVDLNTAAGRVTQAKGAISRNQQVMSSNF